MGAIPGKKIRRITDIGSVIQTVFADYAGVIRVVQAGLDWTPIGLLTNAVKVGVGTPVLVYNSTNGVLYVKFGIDETLSAPTDATNGIPIAIGEKYVLNSGANSWIRASAAGVYGYTSDTGG